MFNMRTHILLLVGLLSLLNCDGYQSEKISTIVQWRRLQFAYPSEQARQNDINSKIYDPDVPAPIDVDVYYKSYYERMIFVSIPKFSEGVPVTFGLVTNQTYNGDPVIAPFPSWDWHRYGTTCPPNRLVSVYRVKIDRCGLLWILDSGNSGNGVICKPQIVVFDLKLWPAKKTPYYRYEFPSQVYDQNSILLTIMVESQGNDCKAGAFAYVADTFSHAIIATDLTKNYSWRIKHSSMEPESAFTNFSIAGDSFELDDGILGMALSPDAQSLYYSPLAGSRLSRISTSDFKRAMDGTTRVPVYTYNSPRNTQSAAMAISSCGVSLFGLMSSITMNCWNIGSSDYGKYIHTVYSNQQTMQFASGAKVVRNPFNGQEEFWVMTSRFQKLATTGYNFNEVNFRISMGRVNDLLYGSPCSKPNY